MQNKARDQMRLYNCNLMVIWRLQCVKNIIWNLNFGDWKAKVTQDGVATKICIANGIFLVSLFCSAAE